MKWSSLFKHYQEHEPKMLENIRKDKKEHGYKLTSRRMFEVEVGVMTDVIKNLNKRDINVLYVYDALLCEEKDKVVVAQVMNRIALEYGVKTSVKVDQSRQYRLEDEINLYELFPVLSFSVRKHGYYIRFGWCEGSNG